eukprot:335694-Hanusia_phi.AAC.3
MTCSSSRRSASACAASRLVALDALDDTVNHHGAVHAVLALEIRRLDVPDGVQEPAQVHHAADLRDQRGEEGAVAEADSLDLPPEVEVVLHKGADPLLPRRHVEECRLPQQQREHLRDGVPRAVKELFRGQGIPDLQGGEGEVPGQERAAADLVDEERHNPKRAMHQVAGHQREGGAGEVDKAALVQLREPVIELEVEAVDKLGLPRRMHVRGHRHGGLAKVADARVHPGAGPVQPLDRDGEVAPPHHKAGLALLEFVPDAVHDAHIPHHLDLAGEEANNQVPEGAQALAPIAAGAHAGLDEARAGMHVPDIDEAGVIGVDLELAHPVLVPGGEGAVAELEQRTGDLVEAHTAGLKGRHGITW